MQRTLASTVVVIGGLLVPYVATAELMEWRMKDGKTIKAELRCAWGEGDAAMVDFLLPGMKVLALKRGDIHPEDLNRIPAPPPRYDDFRFAWATARPVTGQANQVTIVFEFQRTLPGVRTYDEKTLRVAPFMLGSVLVPPEAWKVTHLAGPDGASNRFQTTGTYDASKLIGSKFSATMDLEVGKDSKRIIQRVDFPKTIGGEIKSTIGDFEIKSYYLPTVGEIESRYVVIVKANPMEKLIRFLVESNERTADSSGLNARDAGTFATVKIDYWESFEKRQVHFEGTAGKPQTRIFSQ